MRLFLETCIVQVTFTEAFVEPDRLRARILPVGGREANRAAPRECGQRARADPAQRRVSARRRRAPARGDRSARAPDRGGAREERDRPLGESARAAALAFPTALAPRWMPGLSSRTPAVSPACRSAGPPTPRGAATARRATRPRHFERPSAPRLDRDRDRLSTRLRRVYAQLPWANSRARWQIIGSVQRANARNLLPPRHTISTRGVCPRGHGARRWRCIHCVIGAPRTSGQWRQNASVSGNTYAAPSSSISIERHDGSTKRRAFSEPNLRPKVAPPLPPFHPVAMNVVSSAGVAMCAPSRSVGAPAESAHHSPQSGAGRGLEHHVVIRFEATLADFGSCDPVKNQRN
jgi:hypothetical protein